MSCHVDARGSHLSLLPYRLCISKTRIHSSFKALDSLIQRCRLLLPPSPPILRLSSRKSAPLTPRSDDTSVKAAPKAYSFAVAGQTQRTFQTLPVSLAVFPPGALTFPARAQHPTNDPVNLPGHIRRCHHRLARCSLSLGLCLATLAPQRRPEIDSARDNLA